MLLKEVLLSVGIDIGTSTTQVVFSNITIENLASNFTVPRIEIVDKEIIYRSEISFTPLISQTLINMEEVKEIVSREYEKSGLKKEDIKTGAVVITGETARKENADVVVQVLSEFAGDFVVATAGPDLESIIAGKGAGTDIYSKKHSTVAANFDVGGGTSNFALFKNGELVTTSCLDIGGRLIKLDKVSNKITYIAPKIAKLISTKGMDLKVGDEINIPKLEEIGKYMTEILEMGLGLREKSNFYAEILTLEGRDIILKSPLTNVSFSGGVADYIYGNEEEKDLLKYGDIGIILGRAIKNSKALQEINIIPASETIGATVVGAGSHITEISGSTIDYDENMLPMKNIPILKLQMDDEENGQTISKAIEEKLDWFKVEEEVQQTAIAITGKKSPSFKEVVDLAKGIIEGSDKLIKRNLPLIIIVENDFAKVLGQSINNILNYSHPVVCIDSIIVTNGDYIDIGLPVANGGVLPVVIKTLIFK